MNSKILTHFQTSCESCGLTHMLQIPTYQDPPPATETPPHTDTDVPPLPPLPHPLPSPTQAFASGQQQLCGDGRNLGYRSRDCASPVGCFQVVASAHLLALCFHPGNDVCNAQCRSPSYLWPRSNPRSLLRRFGGGGARVAQEWSRGGISRGFVGLDQ